MSATQIWSISMTNNNENMACRVCGLTQLEPPWGNDGKSPNFEICYCCGVEFGYEDRTFNSINNYRKKWLEKGSPWFYSKEKPENWNLQDQLGNIPDNFK